MREIERLREASKAADDKRWPGDPRVWRDDSYKFQFGLGAFLTTLLVVSIAIGLFVQFPQLLFLAFAILLFAAGFVAFCGLIGGVFSLFMFALYSLANDNDAQRKRENIDTSRRMTLWCFAAMAPFLVIVIFGLVAMSSARILVW